MFIAIILLISCSPVPARLASIQQGGAALDFSLKAARGGSYHLGDLKGQTILLSFLNSQANAASGQSDPSRAQIVFLKSMQEQYGGKGLTVWIVDAARLVTGKQPSLDDLINFTYDWQLDAIPVLIDDHANTAAAYGVSSIPSTFLIGPDGVIRQRWDGQATASQLSLSEEA